MTWKEKADLLEQNMSIAHLFSVLCLEKEKTFAVWLEGDAVKTSDYAELESRSFACAENITKTGFGKKGGWTGIAVDTCTDWPVLFWGVMAAGRNALLLDPSLDDAGIDHLMKEAGGDSLITRRQRNLPYAQKTPEEALGESFAPTPGFTPDWADLLAACTSGTTATSRVYVYNGEAICRQIIGFSEHLKYPCFMCEEESPVRTVAFLPMNHIFGLLTNVITTPFLDSPQIFLKDRSPMTILETCRKADAEMLLTVPLLVNSISTTIQKRVAAESAVKRVAFRMMQGISLTCQRINPRFGLKVGKKLFKSINKNLFGDSMAQLVVGGARVPSEHMRVVNALGYAVTVGFGMTETAITSYENKIDLKSRVSGSVGLPLPISTYTVIPDGGDTNRGELLIKCDAMHIGRLSAGVLLPPVTDSDGWFHTGDIVRLGKKGRMWIEGRVKDVIIGESGENVYPDELEDVFTGIEGVEQLSVLGINQGDDELIALVLNVGERYDDEEFLKELAAKVDRQNKTLRPLKRVRLVYATPEPLPVVSAIKVKRAEIRKRITEGSYPCKRLSVTKGVSDVVSGANAPSPAKEPKDTSVYQPEFDEIRQKIKECFARELEIDPGEIGDDTSFTEDIDSDSLHRLGALLRVENELDIVIPEEAYENCTTVNDLARVVFSIKTGGDPQPEQSQAEETLPDETPETEEAVEVTPITNFADSPEYKAFIKRYDLLNGCKNPYFICHESPLKDTSIMEGREVLNFGSYNYVGMSGRKETSDAAKAAIDKYGTSASGSRLLAGEKQLYKELEKEIADWKSADDALVFVGGHSTNVTVVGNFCGRGDLIIYDAFAHNSIREGARLSEAVTLRFRHNDTAALENLLKLHRKKYAKCLIIVEGVYSMDGDIAPIPEFVRLKKKYGCFLMVDEAHSACVIGKTGGGVDEYFGLDPKDIDFKMGTLSKGLGACGGYIAGPAEIIEYLRYNAPGFVFSVGISPALAASVLAAIKLLRSDPTIIESLQKNIKMFIEEAKKRNLNTLSASETAVIPVLVGSDEDTFILSNKMGELGVFVPPAIFPAVPKGKSRLRFCVISEHKPEQIIKALDILEEAAKSCGISLPSPDSE